jgi:hypothetical protein
MATANPNQGFGKTQQMPSAENEALARLAEADGATFTPSGTGTWRVQDRHGVIIASGALSRDEAARLYCEDKDLVASSPEAILAWIKAQYRPYDSMPEFEQGFRAYQLDGPHRLSPHSGGVAAQAFDRGANAAMLYARAMAHLKDHPEAIEKAGPGWLSRLIRTGRP